MRSVPTRTGFMGRVILFGIALLTVAACSFGGSTPPDDRVDAQREDLVGTWRNSPRAGVLELAEDGTFTADNVPYQMFAEFADLLPGLDLSKERLVGTGTWELKTSREDPTGPHNSLWLSFDLLNGAAFPGSFRLIAERADAAKPDSATVLTVYIGDPDVDNRYVYEKCAANCVP